ncbi:MAG: T9SS type A sorting domain-containing protein [Cyclobacteriaceae bacterium]
MKLNLIILINFLIVNILEVYAYDGAIDSPAGKSIERIITQSGATDPGARILDFTLPQQTSDVSIDTVTATILVEVLEGTDRASLIPQISIPAGTTISPESNVPQDFTRPVVYTLTTQSGTVSTKWKVIVTETNYIKPALDWVGLGIPVINSFDIDKYNSLYVTGSFSRISDLDPGPDTVEVEAKSINYSDLYVYKLDENRNLLWHKAIGGDYSDVGWSVVADDHHVYVFGNYSGSVDFGSGTGDFVLNDSGSFIMKMDLDGNIIWVQRIHGYAGGIGLDADLDAEGNIYLYGSFNRMIQIGSGDNAVEFRPKGYSDTYVCKFTSDGDLVWARQYGSDDPIPKYTTMRDIIVSGGEITVVGASRGMIDFDPDPDSENILDGNGTLVLRLDTTGNFMWVQRTSGTIGAMALDIDSKGNIYVAGEYAYDLRFYPNGANLLTGGSNQGYLMKLDTKGELVWVRDVGESGHLSKASSVKVTDDYSLYLCGWFSRTADFNLTAGEYLVTAETDYDAFLMKSDTAANFKWVRTLPSDVSIGMSDVEIDQVGNIIAKGFYYNQDVEIDFDPGPGVYRSSLDHSGYIWKLNEKDIAGKNAEIMTAYFAEQDVYASIDRNNRTITAYFEDGTDLSTLKLTLMLSRGATKSLADNSTVDLSQPYVVSVTSEDGLTTNDWTITALIGPATETDFLVFEVREQIQKGVINKEEHTIIISVHPASDITRLAPVFELSDGATSVPASGTVQDFTEPVVYRVTAENGTNTQDWVVSVDLSPEIIWNGTSWSNATGPAATDNVIINGNYSFLDNGSFTVADLTVKEGFLLLVNNNETLVVNGSLENNGAITIASGAGLITYQKNEITGNAITFNRKTRYADGRYSFVGSPVQENDNITGKILGKYVYRYDEQVPYAADGLNRWVAVADEILQTGHGYTQAFREEIVFKGIPNNGEIIYPATYTEDTANENEGWHLVANPYPSAISTVKFLFENLNLTGAIYIWDDNNSQEERGRYSDYIVANVITYLTNSRAGNAERYNRHLGSMQGFFVKLFEAEASEIRFTEDMRVEGYNADDNFFRTEADHISLAKVNLTNQDGLFKQTAIAWLPDAQDTQMSRLYDAPVFDPSAENLLYTQKLEVPLAIQGLSLSNERVLLGMNLKADGMYQLDLQSENLEGMDLYLVDHLTGKQTRLTNKPYSFMATAGKYPDRFEIRTQSIVLNSQENDSDWSAYVSRQRLFIQQRGDLQANKLFVLYDLNGRVMLDYFASDPSGVNLESVPSGIYLLSDGTKVQKLIK